jgi:hypothetical protein
VRLGILVLAVTLDVHAAIAEPPPLTHTTPLTPTGEVLPRGHVQRHQTLTAFHAPQTRWIGAWWSVRSMRGGISAALLHIDAELPALPVLPLLSFAWDHDL